MLTAFGTLLFLVLTISAVIGLVMCIGACMLFFVNGLQRIGIAICGSGMLGAAIALAGFRGFGMLGGNAVAPTTEALLLVSAAGFAWFSLLSIVLLFGLSFLRQPARWIDRKRKTR